MKLSRRWLATVAVAGAACAYAGVDGYVSTSLSTAAQSAGGAWTDAGSWNPEGVPGDNARITLTPASGSDPVLTIPADVTRKYRLLFLNLNKRIASLSIDGEGKSLTMPYSSEGYYENTAFNVCDGVRYLFQASNSSTSPVLEWTDAFFKAGYDGQRSSVRFERGTFDFRNVSATATARDILLANYNANGDIPTTIAVNGNASLTAGSVKYYGAVDGDELVIDGGRGDFSSLGVESKSETVSIPRSFALKVVDGASLTAGSFTDSHKASESGEVVFEIDVVDSTLAVTNGNFSLSPSDKARTVLKMENSVLAVTNGIAVFGGSAASEHALDVSFAGSRVLMPSSLTVGAGGLGVTDFTAVDTTFDVLNFDLYSGVTASLSGVVFDYSGNPGAVSNILRHGSHLTIKGSSSVTDLGALTVGGYNPNDKSNREPAVLTLDGGKFSMTAQESYCGVGVLDGANGTMILTNGAHLTIGGSARYTVGNRNNYNNADGRIEIYDSTLHVATGKEFVIGDWGSNAKDSVGSGHVKVGRGGVLDHSSGVVSIGRYCVPGTLEICDGGVADIASVIMENSTFIAANPLVTNRLVQSGGELTVKSLTLVNGGSRCEAHFLGGEAWTEKIIPGNGLKGGKAEGVVYGNGGMLVAMEDQDQFMTGLSSVEIGAGGLVIDTNGKTIGIRQDISDMSGEFGVLTVGGGGTAVIVPSGDWTVSKTLVKGASVAFESEATVLAGEVELAYGGVLSLAGATTSLEVDALTVEEGVILVDPGDVIKVPASGLDLKNFTLSCTGERTADETNSVFEITGELSERNALAIVAALERGRTTGSFDEAVVETVEGTTFVKVVRRGCAPALSKVTEWNGASAQGWSDENSWTAGVPASDTVISLNMKSSFSSVPPLYR